ncbi:MAG: hypothetical protein HXX17_15705 [Geobacteraceae bacterium]|nr:hypothetical protein [Geobacteraceae bacterium]
MLTVNCIFPKGIIIQDKDGANRIFRNFILEEEVGKHTFDVMNDDTLDRERLANDPGYYSAALLASRIKLQGIENVTPEIVQDLHPLDLKYLLGEAADLDQRRDLFRSEIEAAQKGYLDTEETGILDNGSHGDEPG